LPTIARRLPRPGPVSWEIDDSASTCFLFNHRRTAAKPNTLSCNGYNGMTTTGVQIQSVMFETAKKFSALAFKAP
jgi:hypothetical protein